MKSFACWMAAMFATVGLAATSSAQQLLFRQRGFFYDANTYALRGQVDMLIDVDGTAAYAGNGVFYTVDASTLHLKKFDSRTGQVTVIGSLGTGDVECRLAIDPTSGRLYLLTRLAPTSFNYQLFQVDPATAATTAVGPQMYSPGSSASFCINAQGQGIVVGYSSISSYQAKFNRRLIDLTTGQLSASADLNPTIAGSSSIPVYGAALRADGKLIVQTGSCPGSTDCYALNLATLTVAAIPQLPGPCFSPGMLYIPDAADVGFGYVEGCSAPSGCPCGGLVGNGCINSASNTGANLRAFGDASLSSDTLQLIATGMPSTLGLFFQSATLGPGAPFGNGKNCIIGIKQRMGTGTIVSGALAYPTVGAAPISVAGNITAPGTLHYQAYFRDQALPCNSGTINTTNSLSVNWVP